MTQIRTKYQKMIQNALNTHFVCSIGLHEA